MKYLFSILIMLLVSCTETSNSNVSDTSNIPDMQCTPVGATYIKSINNVNDDGYNWVMWKFEGQCYLSLYLCYNGAVLTSITCPPN